MVAFRVEFRIGEKLPEESAGAIAGGGEPVGEEAGALGIGKGLAELAHVGDFAGVAGNLFVALDVEGGVG